MAGTRFEEKEIGGIDHFDPVHFVNPELKTFAVSGSATSVTVTINAATISLSNGEPATVCDTPGFGDTKGVEMEISNQEGVIHGLKGAASIRPFVVIDYNGMSAARFSNLRKTLGTIILMMGKNPDFAPFQYIFTRCDKKKSTKICKQLAHFLRSRNEGSHTSTEGHTIFDAFLQDMIAKTTPKAVFIDPEDEEAALGILERLWSNETPRLESPSTTFVEFLSEENSHKLKTQMNHRNARMKIFLEKGDYSSCETLLQEQMHFADALPLPVVVKELDSGRKVLLDFILQQGSGVRPSMELILKARHPGKELVENLGEQLSQFSKLEILGKLCNLPESETFDSILKTTLNTLFGGISDALTSLENSDVVSHAEDLQHALLCRHYLIEGLNGIVGTNKLRALASASLNKAIDLVKHQLTTVQQDLENPTASALKESRPELEFLVLMKSFLSETGNSAAASQNDDWKWLTEGTEILFAGLANASRSGASKLEEHTMEEDFTEHYKAWRKSLAALVSDTQLAGCRSFLLELSSFPVLWQLVHRNQEEGDKDPGMNVAIFDKALSTAMGNFSKFAHAWTKEAAATKEDRSTKKKKAETLLEAVKTAIQACEQHRDSDSSSLDSSGKLLIEAKVEIKAFIKKNSGGIQRPDELPCDPKEVGEKWFAMLVQLNAYRIEHGHCNVPQKYKKAKQLGLVSSGLT